MYYLQSRWKLENRELYYYGLRNRENLFHNRIPLSAGQAAVLASLPRELSDKEKALLGPLLGVQVVPPEMRKKFPEVSPKPSSAGTAVPTIF